MSGLARWLPNLKDVGLSTSEYVHKRFEQGGVSEDALREMVRHEASIWATKQLMFGNEPTVMGFQDEFDVWEGTQYIDLIEAVIENEKDLFEGRRPRH